MTSNTVERLAEECKRNPTQYYLLNYDELNSNLFSHLYFDNVHHFFQCLIEKVGCSFFKRFLYFFSNVHPQLESPFDLSLNEAHRVNLDKFSDLSHPDSLLTQESYKKIIFVRDPYSRLFSGYVDKIFSRYNAWRSYNRLILARIGRYSLHRICADDVSFAEFVKFFVQTMQKGVPVNGHFLPMYLHCKPCEVKYDFVGKLEKFDRDVRIMMHHIGLSNYTYLLQKAKEAGIRDELKDVAIVLFGMRSRSNSDKCFDSYKAAVRQWRKLQIKGLLSLKIRFPYSQRVWKTIDQDRFHNMLIDVHKLSKTIDNGLHKNQRKAMAEAYQTLSPETRKSLKEILEPDCKLFGYDVNPTFEKQKTDKTKFFDFRNL